MQNSLILEGIPAYKKVKPCTIQISNIFMLMVYICIYVHMHIDTHVYAHLSKTLSTLSYIYKLENFFKCCFYIHMYLNTIA